MDGQTDHDHHHDHHDHHHRRRRHGHHHWLDSPMWALALEASAIFHSAIASLDFATRVFSRVGLSAPHPTPGYPGEPMFSVRVVSLS
jgi:hypothetical protein